MWTLKEGRLLKLLGFNLKARCGSCRRIEKAYIIDNLTQLFTLIKTYNKNVYNIHRVFTNKCTIFNSIFVKLGANRNCKYLSFDNNLYHEIYTSKLYECVRVGLHTKTERLCFNVK